MKPRIAMTVGDPAGIGPEIARKAAEDLRVREACEPVLYGPPAGAVFAPGILSAEAGRAAYESICVAVRDAQTGTVSGIATAPVNKIAFARAGLPWKGHTDLLAHLTGSARVAMMFWSERLKVILASVHVPLAEVPRMLTRELLDAVIDLAACELPRFGLANPRLALAGLNPHAGEEGLIRNGGATRAATGGRGGPGAWGRDRGSMSRRHDFRARVARRVRCRYCLLSRSRVDPGEAARFRPGGQRHARPADSPAPPWITARRSTSPGGEWPIRRA